jgi:hypothetical protein
MPHKDHEVRKRQQREHKALLRAEARAAHPKPAGPTRRVAVRAATYPLRVDETMIEPAEIRAAPLVQAMGAASPAAVVRTFLRAVHRAYAQGCLDLTVDADGNLVDAALYDTPEADDPPASELAAEPRPE